VEKKYNKERRRQQSRKTGKFGVDLFSLGGAWFSIRKKKIGLIWTVLHICDKFIAGSVEYYS
jgi:hypothetical protein